MTLTLENAIEQALNAHKGQKDKVGLPYILHPLRVMFRCGDDTERFVAVLHDVVEDTKTTLDDLRKAGYSEEIIEAVDAITQRQGESEDEYMKRVVQNPIASRVKVAELQDNMDWARLNRYIKTWRKLKGIEA